MSKSNSCCFGLIVFLTFLFVCNRLNGQKTKVSSVGEISDIRIIQEEHCSYLWELFSGTDNKMKASAEQVKLLSFNGENNLKIKWLMKGDFLVTVSAISLKGCTNSKGIHIRVDLNHQLTANNDYYKFCWSDTIRMEPVQNDFDTDNDLDLRTLKIIQPPQLGKLIINQSGSISYSSSQIRECDDFFVYEICDTCKNCDQATVFLYISDPPINPVEAISPNQDGLNDYFKINGIEAFPNSTVKIFNRLGQVIYSNKNYKNEWDGRLGKDSKMLGRVPTGVYYFVLKLGQTNRFFKGFVYVAY